MTDDQQKRRRGRPKTFDRQRTIELAMDSYWREGVHSLSLNEVCRRARMSKPSLYREFGDEDGLMEAVLGHYRELIVVPVLEALVAELPFAELAEMLVAGMTADHGTPAGCLFTEMRLARSRLGPMSTTRVRAMEQERREAFEIWYRRALERGEVDASISPELAARYIDTQLATVLVQLGAGEPPEVVRQQARLALRVLRASREGQGIAPLPPAGGQGRGH
ncbi:MAG: AcrR family transcriptional regulator [Myxococcota bacterium]|jgi:AcrR family transcriptional regulator